MTDTLGTALVTGGGSGIGLAIARRLAAGGAAVVLMGRRIEPLEAAARELGESARVVAGDVREPESIEKAVAEAGEVSILINAAGIIQAAPVHEFDVAAFDDILSTNLRGPFLLCRAVVPGMRSRGGGVIVNIGSVASRASFPGMGVYAASKAGLSALGGVIRAESRSEGVRVVDVIAGATATTMWDDFWPDAPVERMMRPEDVADAVFTAVTGPGRATIEELVIRPVEGDL